jgi:hypothetical protein
VALKGVPSAPLPMVPAFVPARWGFDRSRPTLANLHGDYGYLGEGYYRSLEAERAGHQVVPTTADALDALVVPIALAKAEAFGLPVPEAEIVTDRFPEPPLLVYPINPFSIRGELLLDRAAVEARRKGLTYTGKYAVQCQRLPADHRIDVIKVVMGRCTVKEYGEYTRSLFECFRLPLMKVRVIVTTRAYLLSAIEPLPFRRLAEDDRALLQGAIQWPD